MTRSKRTKKEIALQIEYRDIETLIPYARNARTHSDEQVAQIASSIKEFGFNDPIAVDGDNGIIEGHGRVLAARKLELKVVPVIELKHLTDNQKRAYMLAHNKIALNASWEKELLDLELDDLNTIFKMEDFGFEAAKHVEFDTAAKLTDALVYKVIVDCSNEAEQLELLERFESEGYKCHPLTS